MTWIDGAVCTEPAGHESAKKTGILIRCDVCGLGEEFISHTAAARGGPEAVQRLLYRRDWTANLSTGEDACPTCTLKEATPC